MSAEVWAGLQEELHAGRIVRLEDAREHLKRRWGNEYSSPSGVWPLFKQHGVKLKTRRQRR